MAIYNGSSNLDLSQSEVTPTGTDTPEKLADMAKIAQAAYNLSQQAINEITEGFTISGAAGTDRMFTYATGTSKRFDHGITADVENGSNNGSNFTIRRYSDTGEIIDTPFEISRSTGLIDMSVPDAVADQNPVSLKQFNAALSFISVGVFTEDSTVTVDPRANWIRIRAVGGGGGGGGCPATEANEEATGGGGLGGAYVELLIPALALGKTFTITIGAAGAGGSGNDYGTNGGNTIIGNNSEIVVPGGAGGFPGSIGSVNLIFQNTLSTNVPTSTVGTIITSLSPSNGPVSNIIFGTSAGQQKGGDGGNSPFGYGGPGSVGGSSTNGAAAQGYGAGGGGSALGASGAQNTGGNGTAGYVVLEFLK